MSLLNLIYKSNKKLFEIIMAVDADHLFAQKSHITFLLPKKDIDKLEKLSKSKSQKDHLLAHALIKGNIIYNDLSADYIEANKGKLYKNNLGIQNFKIDKEGSKYTIKIDGTSTIYEIKPISGMIGSNGRVMEISNLLLDDSNQIVIGWIARQLERSKEHKGGAIDISTEIIDAYGANYDSLYADFLGFLNDTDIIANEDYIHYVSTNPYVGVQMLLQPTVYETSRALPAEIFNRFQKSEFYLNNSPSYTVQSIISELISEPPRKNYEVLYSKPMLNQFMTTVSSYQGNLLTSPTISLNSVVSAYSDALSTSMLTDDMQRLHKNIYGDVVLTSLHNDLRRFIMENFDSYGSALNYAVLVPGIDIKSELDYVFAIDINNQDIANAKIKLIKDFINSIYFMHNVYNEYNLKVEKNYSNVNGQVNSSLKITQDSNPMLSYF